MIKKILTTTVGLLLLISVKGYALEMSPWSVYIGGGYNNFEMKDINDLTEDDINSATSFVGGIKRNINDYIKLGIEIDTLEVDWSNDGYKVGTTGYLITAEHILLAGLYVFGAGGVYFAETVEVPALYEKQTKSGIGYKIGLQYMVELTDKIGIQTRAGYREDNIKIDSLDLNFSGFTSDLSFVIHF